MAGGALLVLTTSAFAQECAQSEDDWVSTDWAVVCSVDVVEELDEYENLVSTGVSSETVCSASREDTPTSIARAVLVEASKWLKGLCFRPPVVPEYKREKGRRAYKGTLSRAATAGDAGVYVDGELFVDYDYFVGEDHATREPTQGGLATLPHELFHAIQAGYPAGRTEGYHNWVIEGTAEAVELAWVKQRGWQFRGSTRYFDDPLHRPRSKEHSYRTSLFWLWLGRELASPSEIGYLAELFDDREFLEDRGVDDLESFLSTRRTRLYDLYPRFIAERVTDSEMYAAGSTRVAIRYDEPKAEEAHRSRVKLLAADPVTVEAHVPADKFAEIRIELREDDPEFHLVVDETNYGDIDPLGGMPETQRILKPENRAPRWQRQRNRFVASVGGGDEPAEFFVRVVHVKREHGKGQGSDGRKPYVLDIELEPLLECQFSASLTGDTTRSAARGKVAHFSTAGGATIQGLMTGRGNAGAMADFLQSMAGDRLSDAEREQIEQQARQWEQEAAALPTETLGLSLMEMNVGDASNAALAAAIGGFKLQASIFDQPIEPGFTGALQPGLVSVMTGDWTDDVSQKVRYQWAPGEPGDASLVITQYAENLLTGTLTATLTGQGVYKTETGEPPKLTVSAGFRAVPHDPLRGELGCITRDR